MARNYSGLFLLESQPERLKTDAIMLHGFAAQQGERLLALIQEIAQQAPFRHMITPGSYRMSVAMTNCGIVGWITDKKGYRYDTVDPLTQKHWPPMPAAFLELATHAAVAAGFKNFQPDCCLINRYKSGAKLSLHQDKDEQDFTAPIVSVSLGLPAIFLFGGLTRAVKPMRIPLLHSDVVVWGGTARLAYHGVMPLKEGAHPLTGRNRFNLTFRKAQ